MKKVIILCILLGLAGCQVGDKVSDHQQREGAREEIKSTKVDLKGVPLTFIGSHQAYLMANNLQFLFPEQTKQEVEEVWFRSIYYAPNQRELYYVNGGELIRQTPKDIESLGQIDYDDYSVMRYGTENGSILYSSTTSDENHNDLFDLYVRTADIPFMKVAPKTYFFDFSEKGDVLFYITNQFEVKRYDVASKSEKGIAEGYQRLDYLDEIDALLLQKTDGSVDFYYKGKITKMGNQMEFFDDQVIQVKNDYLYFLDHQSHNLPLTNLTILLNEINDLEISGRLMRYNLKEGKVESVSDKRVKGYKLVDKRIYFITEEGQLYSTEDRVNLQLISDDVSHLMANSKLIYGLKKNGELVEIADEGIKLVNLKVDCNAQQLINASINEGDVAYLTTDKELIINGRPVAWLCENAVYQNGIVIALTIEDKIYSINPKTGEEFLIFEGIENYDEIYAGNQLLRYRAFNDDQVENKVEAEAEHNSSNEAASNQTISLEELSHEKQLSVEFKDKHFSESNDFIMPQSLSDYLSAADLLTFTRDELALIRNEVFARYGSIFDTEFYQAYFDSNSWCHPSTKNISMDSVVKVKLDLIQSFENEEISFKEEIINGSNLLIINESPSIQLVWDFLYISLDSA